VDFSLLRETAQEMNRRARTFEADTQHFKFIPVPGTSPRRRIALAGQSTSIQTAQKNAATIEADRPAR
jgi:hypothetical protein